MKRSPMPPRTTRLRQGKRLRQVSKRRAGKLTEWERTKRQVLARNGGWCEFPWPLGSRCPRRAIDAHHVRRAGQGGADEDDNLLSLCRAHHRAIHDHPAAAYALGLLIRSGG